MGEGCAEPHWGKEIWREEVSRQPRSVAQTYTHTHYSKEREKDRFYFTKEAEFPNPNCALIIKSLIVAIEWGTLSQCPFQSHKEGLKHTKDNSSQSQDVTQQENITPSHSTWKAW